MVPYHRPMPHVIRLATQADAEAMAEIYAPVVRDTAISFEAVPPDAAAFRERMRDVLRLAPWLVRENDGRVTGYAYATTFRARPAYRFTVETTVYVDRDFGRRGLGRAAMAAVVAILRLQGAHLAVAGITLPNPGSVRLHEALGYVAIGEFEAIGWKQGGWHGVAWYALELGPREPVPSPLVSLPALAGTPALEAALAQGQSTSSS